MANALKGVCPKEACEAAELEDDFGNEFQIGEPTKKAQELAERLEAAKEDVAGAEANDDTTQGFLKELGRAVTGLEEAHQVALENSKVKKMKSQAASCTKCGTQYTVEYQVGSKNDPEQPEYAFSSEALSVL